MVVIGPAKRNQRSNQRRSTMTKTHPAGVRRAGCSALLAASIGVSGSPAMSAVTFTQLGYGSLTPASGSQITVGAISGDGSVVVGAALIPFGQPGASRYAYEWSNSGAVTDLGTSPFTTSGYGQAWAYGVSSDGLVVSGRQIVAGAASEAFVQVGGTRTVIGPSGWTETQGASVSGDGTVVVGYGIDPSTPGGIRSRGFVYNVSSNTSTALAMDASWAQNRNAAALDVSADGSTIVGRAYDLASDDQQAVAWVNGAATNLGVNAAVSSTDSRAVAVSADGSTIVGYYEDSSGNNQSFIRASSGTVTTVSLFGTAFDEFEAFDVSGDGSMIVGLADPTAGGTSRATLWTQALGVVDLNTYLTSLGVNLTGWDLTEATTISADGTSIAGIGVFNGVSYGWVVNGLGSPSAVPGGAGLTALAFGAAGLRGRRRSRN
jgi:uncharacterized membrane protein